MKQAEKCYSICQPGTRLSTQRSAGTAFKTMSGGGGRGAVHRGPQTLLFRLGTRAGILGTQMRISPCAALGAARALSFCLSSPSSCSSPSPAATGFYLHCSLKPSSECAARPSTRSRSQELPLKLQRIITTSCSGLLAGQLCKQAS